MAGLLLPHERARLRSFDQDATCVYTMACEVCDVRGMVWKLVATAVAAHVCKALKLWPRCQVRIYDSLQIVWCERDGLKTCGSCCCCTSVQGSVALTKVPGAYLRKLANCVMWEGCYKNLWQLLLLHKCASSAALPKMPHVCLRWLAKCVTS